MIKLSAISFIRVINHMQDFRRLKVWEKSDYKQLDKGTIEIKQMLATLIKKLKTDS
jgi:hypothetical protein